MIRTIIADDHFLLRQVIRVILDRADDIEVIGEACNGLEAIRLVEKLAPDVLVTDITMPGLNGIEAAKRIQAKGLTTRALIVSVHLDNILAQQALNAGAQGYVLKISLATELLTAVRAIQRGDTFLSPTLVAIM
jgi:DNA-binding NarL/FixJ family response regulator